MAAPSRQEAETSPFVERLLRKGYEVLYMVDPVDEYTVQVCGGVSSHTYLYGGRVHCGGAHYGCIVRGCPVTPTHLGVWHGRCDVHVICPGIAGV